MPEAGIEVSVHTRRLRIHSDFRLCGIGKGVASLDSGVFAGSGVWIFEL